METKTMESSTNSLFSTDIFGGNLSEPELPAEKKSPAPLLSQSEQDILSSLSPQEKAQLQSTIKSMDLTAPNFTVEYGKDARVGINNMSKQALSVTRTRDLGDVGESMTHLMMELKELDMPNQTHGIFRRAKSYVAQLNAKLAPAEDNINKAVTIMQKHQEQLANDNAQFDILYKQNLAYYRALSLYIIAGKLKLDEERETTLVALQQKATESGDMADAEKYNSYKSKLDRFDAVLSEFESSRLLCLQTAPAIRIAQENNSQLIQKFEYIFTTAVPAWRIQIHIALNLENSKLAANAANSAIDFTNDLIRKNADMLKQGTINVAELSQREIIEGDTLEYANQRLIESLDSIFQIQADGQAKRDSSRERRQMLEEDLKNELLQLTLKNR